jgi:hypothetical protein
MQGYNDCKNNKEDFCGFPEIIVQVALMRSANAKYIF